MTDVNITKEHLKRNYEELVQFKDIRDGETFRTYEHRYYGEMVSYIITIDRESFFFSPVPFDAWTLKDYRAGNVVIHTFIKDVAKEGVE